MRTLTLLSLGLLAACDGGFESYLDPDELEDDTGVEDDSDVGTDIEDDTEDVDIDTDSGITGTAGDCHGFDPLDIAGWTRTYNVNWKGSLGTETQTSLGEVVAPDGSAAFGVESVLDLGDDGDLTIVYYRRCEAGSLVEVARETSGNVAGGGSFIDDILGDLVAQFGELIELLLGDILGGNVDIDTEQRFAGEPIRLPNAASMSSGQFNYSYTLMTIDHAAAAAAAAGQTGQPTLPATLNCKSDPSLAENDAQCIDVDNQMTLLGSGNVTVGGSTFTASRVIVDSTELWGAASGSGGALPPEVAIFGEILGGFGLGATEDQNIVSDQSFVEGIGIVRERVYNMTDVPPGTAPGEDQLVITRELVNYTGL